MTVQDLLYQFLPVDCIFEREPHIHVLERSDVGKHRDCVVLRAGHQLDYHVGLAGEQVNGLEVDAVDYVYLAGDKGRPSENARLHRSGAAARPEEFRAAKWITATPRPGQTTPYARARSAAA